MIALHVQSQARQMRAARSRCVSARSVQTHDSTAYALSLWMAPANIQQSNLKRSSAITGAGVQSQICILNVYCFIDIVPAVAMYSWLEFQVDTELSLSLSDCGLSYLCTTPSAQPCILTAADSHFHVTRHRTASPHQYWKPVQCHLVSEARQVSSPFG